MVRLAWPWPSRKISRATSAVGSTWRQAPMRPANYESIAREGYGANEIIYACIETICTSAAEPKFCAYRGKQKLETHAILNLLNRPNPFMTRFNFIAGWLLYRNLAGNTFIEKVRPVSGGPPNELWFMRPDRVEALPDPQTFIRGYKYTLGTTSVIYPANDVIHSKTRHALDDVYGMAPMQVLLSRTDTDNFMREFTKSFFYNAAVPAGLLNIKGALDAEEKQAIKGRFRQDLTGPLGWNTLMVIEEAEASYTNMGQPMGQRGIAYPDLDEINEARLCMAFGVPAVLIGARVGIRMRAYGSLKALKASFWEETLIPTYVALEDDLNAYLVPDFQGVDRVRFEVENVRALSEDLNSKATRIVSLYKEGILTRDEARAEMGYDPAPLPAPTQPSPNGTHVNV